MLTVHHLNNSRSQRILWLLEELELDYTLNCYQRDAETNLAPPELEAVHPLGKSPIVTEGDVTVVESGAIIDYILRKHGGGRLQPAPDTVAHEQYLQWLHFAESSAILPMLLKLFVSKTITLFNRIEYGDSGDQSKCKFLYRRGACFLQMIRANI